MWHRLIMCNYVLPDTQVQAVYEFINETIQGLGHPNRLRREMPRLTSVDRIRHSQMLNSLNGINTLLKYRGAIAVSRGGIFYPG